MSIKILIVLIFVIQKFFIDVSSERLIMKLNESTVKAIEDALSNKKSPEIHIEKNNVVLIELSRKVIDKSPYSD